MLNSIWQEHRNVFIFFDFFVSIQFVLKTQSTEFWPLTFELNLCVFNTNKKTGKKGGEKKREKKRGENLVKVS